MIKKTVTYDDLDGNSVTEDFYFNFSKLEGLELDVKLQGGLEGTLARISATEDSQQAYALFKDLLLSAYGRKGPGGKGFPKKDVDGTPMRDYLEASPALGEIIIEMLQNPNDAAKFFEGMLPPKLVAQTKLEQAAEAGQGALSFDEKTEVPTAPPVLEQKGSPEKEFEDYTREELVNMTQIDFNRLVGTDPQKMTQEQLVVAMQRKNQR